MKHKYYLGKCDYDGSGRKNCEAYVTWEIKDGGEFSMQAEIWDPRKTDIYCGGQCVDKVVRFFPLNRKARRMVEVWERWHLNHMHAGCEHQRNEKWEDRRIPPQEVPDSHANRDERGVLAIWVYPKEHKDGLLCMPCPVCGYEYGSKWLKEELPPEVRSEIQSWAEKEPARI